MKLKPLWDFVLIKKVPESTLVWTPNQDKSRIAEVVAMGPDCKTKAPAGLLEVGDRVMVPRGNLGEYEVNGETYYMIRETDIQGRLL